LGFHASTGGRKEMLTLLAKPAKSATAPLPASCGSQATTVKRNAASGGGARLATPSSEKCV
jgi:hypothetical protein